MIVVQDEDASGWSMITTTDGRRGLVPASYLQIDDGESEDSGHKQGNFLFLSTTAVTLYSYYLFLYSGCTLRLHSSK